MTVRPATLAERRLALLLLLGASACSAPAEAPLEAPADVDLNNPRLGDARALVAELDAAVDWTTACGTYWKPEAQRLVVEREPVDGGHFLRGTYTLHDAGPAEAVVAVTCDFGAYQGSYALVHIEGDRAALLAAPVVDETGAPYGPPSAVYSTPAFDGPDTFATMALARGLGDCGARSRYRVAALGSADLVEVRSRDCAGDPQAAPPAEAWPVVYPR